MEALGINLPSLIAQIVNFVLLLVLLSMFAYRPVLRMLDERSARIRESMEQVEAIRQRTVQVEEEVRAQLEESRREGQALIAQAEHFGEELKEQARQAARREAEAIVVRARGEFELERDNAINELRRQFADLAITAAEKVINESLDPARHQRLIREVLEEQGDGRGS